MPCRWASAAQICQLALVPCMQGEKAAPKPCNASPSTFIWLQARRRRYFENTQDIKKRKMRERGQWKRSAPASSLFPARQHAALAGCLHGRQFLQLMVGN